MRLPMRIRLAHCHNLDIIGAVTRTTRRGFKQISPLSRTLVAAFLRLVAGTRRRGTYMKKQIAIVALALTVSTSAIAGERATDAAIGAVSGAVVLGPIGAVAGAFIGYSAGPSMSRAWGVRGRSASARQSRRTASNEPR